MFLIMSGSYINNDLSAEFGRLPPSFLPLSNKRLFHHQISLAKSCSDTVFLSIPDDYVIDSIDHYWLTVNDIHIIRTPIGLSLGEATVACFNLMNPSPRTSLHILFGDTLLSEIPDAKKDIISISKTKNNYTWASIEDDFAIRDLSNSSGHSVICGYFHFSHPNQLIRNITLERWDFIRGVRRYCKEELVEFVETDKWFDFGHINSYFQSKANFTTQRSFNELEITSRFVKKTSSKQSKIKAEANWFKNIPEDIRVYTPHYLGEGVNNNGNFYYKLEYLYNLALNELYVFADTPNVVWYEILNHCFDFIDLCNKNHTSLSISDQFDIDELFKEKTHERLSAYVEQKKFSVDDQWDFNGHAISVQKILTDSAPYLPKSCIPTVMHGDLCFSNIIYDFRTNCIKVIDPRGIDNKGNITISGDSRYDISKLAHSILGLYDYIIAGYHTTSINWQERKICFSMPDTNKHSQLQDFFIKSVEERFGVQPLSLYAMQIHLFLSMLPLHDDDDVRQNALFSNAFRLYTLMKESES
ncbi:hypothetical protein [Aeromonas dhakensis]|uniref:hypothetical protein n=1 Tax=Aeromonas dhakensis TaxID=196024 RepID=UPI00288D7E69|nr:hypothetical protein [Aeromonas dhakensis]